MWKLWKMGIVTLAVGLTTACATQHGTQTINDFSRFTELEIMQSDKAEVYRLFGQPHEVTYVPISRNVVWHYYNVSTSLNPMTMIPFVGTVAGGSDVDLIKASFTFSADGVLTASSRRHDNRYVNSWQLLGDTLTPATQARNVKSEMDRVSLPFDAASAKRAAVIVDSYAR